MKECPNCHTLDDPHWRPRIFDFEVDFCHLSDLEIFWPDLASRLSKQKAGITIVSGPNVYKRTKTDYVWRMWEPLYHVRGWAPKRYYDSAGSKRSADHKKASDWADIKKVVRDKNHHLQSKLGIEA